MMTANRERPATSSLPRGVPISNFSLQVRHSECRRSSWRQSVWKLSLSLRLPPARKGSLLARVAYLLCSVYFACREYGQRVQSCELMRSLFGGFNQRHGAGFCLALVATALALLLGDTIKQALGILLLGIATTWFIASLRRKLGMVFSLIALFVGLWAAALPVWRDWQSYHAALLDFEAARSAALAAKAQ